jgi:hypothetical protein
MIAFAVVRDRSVSHLTCPFIRPRTLAHQRERAQLQPQLQPGAEPRAVNLASQMLDRGVPEGGLRDGRLNDPKAWWTGLGRASAEAPGTQSAWQLCELAVLVS